MLLLQGSGLLPFLLSAGATSPPLHGALGSAAALSALGYIALLRSDLLLFGGWREV